MFEVSNQRYYQRYVHCGLNLAATDINNTHILWCPKKETTDLNTAYAKGFLNTQLHT